MGVGGIREEAEKWGFSWERREWRCAKREGGGRKEQNRVQNKREWKEKKGC